MIYNCPKQRHNKDVYLYLILSVLVIAGLSFCVNKFLDSHSTIVIVSTKKETNTTIYIDTPKPTNTPTPTPTQTPQPIIKSNKTLEQLGVKPEYIHLVEYFAQQTSIDVKLAAGMLLTENRGQNPEVQSQPNIDGSVDHGLWQLNGIPEYNPEKNTEHAISILNNKRLHLEAFGYPNPPIKLLIESYNKGAAGAIYYGSTPYADMVFSNAGM